ncbi:hypothetical protein PMM47T1_19015 [Pseudomonas sp. M47T1]|uniref:hypothetical protein n=1 Tax=unclassified Pseudomonas TaxID=196821 RepID=UPI0002606F9B|nr:hypothetical protein [Pseudomonas sp. M47T1]EIK95074.1 hypothetical protein PMM47T1_19015 [Pseudomonas sp. M47T1]
MQFQASQLMVNPCDDEEDNMALVCCHDEKGGMILITRLAEDKDVEFTLGEEDPCYVRDFKVTLDDKTLTFELAADDADVLNGDVELVINYDSSQVDLPEVEETLRNILDGTGTYVSHIAR